MLERFNPLLRLVCLALAGLALFQASRVFRKHDVIARSSLEMPAPKPKPEASTNNATSTNAVSKTNSPAASRRPNMPPGMPRMGGPGANVPPEIQAAVDKIKQSQILGVEMKPPPMALIGIAGKDVFLRGPDGQTGVIREGEQLGAVKLIRIGINRVLVEENGEQKELTVFDGFGSETLMPNKKEHSESPH